MDRRRFLLTSLAGAFAAPLAAKAQQPRKAPRIGILILQPASPAVQRLLDTFRDGLRAHGWTDATLEYRYAEGKPEQLPDLVAELIRLRVDLIVTTTGRATVEAKKLTTTIPIVMTTSGDAIAQGAVASLARPGGNVTGVTMSAPELTQKQLELLKQALPGVSRLAVIRCGGPASAVGGRQWTEVQAVAPRLGLKIRPLTALGPDDVDSVMKTAVKERVDAAFLLSCPVIPSRIADVAIKQRVPMVFTSTSYVQAGGLMAYGPALTEAYRRAAEYVDKILRGARPADLPVEQPTQFELAINLKTAKALGLTIPPSLLARADQVIE